jgi:hypothetical protein
MSPEDLMKRYAINIESNKFRRKLEVVTDFLSTNRLPLPGPKVLQLFTTEFYECS